MSLEVLLVDDHQVMRAGLRVLLEREDDIRVVGEANNGREAIDMVATLKPDVVIMDLSMPDLNGFEATQRILTINPDVKVIGLSMHTGKKIVSKMLGAGAKGYLVKSSTAEDLVKAIHAVSNNRFYLSEEINTLVLEDYQHHYIRTMPQPSLELSIREREVLQLIAEGHSTQQISERLNISHPTIRTHRMHIMEKLGKSNISDLVKYALQEGLIAID